MKFERPDTSRTTKPQDYMIFGYEQAEDYFYDRMQHLVREFPNMVHESYEELHDLVFGEDNPNFLHSESGCEIWMGTYALRCLRYVTQMEQDKLGKSFFSYSAWDVANNYWYWIGDLVVQNYYKAVEYDGMEARHKRYEAETDTNPTTTVTHHRNPSTEPFNWESC